MELENKSSQKKKAKNTIPSMLEYEDLYSFDADETFVDNSLIEKELTKKIPTPRRISPEEKIQKSQDKWRKIETKSEELLNKAKRTEEKAYQKRNTDVTTTSYKRNKIKRKASLIEFRCMKGLKKEILLNIQKNYFIEDELHKSAIDSEEIQIKTGKSFQQIRNAILSLKDEEWFTVIYSSYSGVREVMIDPKNFNL